MQISARKTLEYFKLEVGSSALLCLSLETIAGKMMLVRSLLGLEFLFGGDHSLNAEIHLLDQSLLSFTETVAV